MASEVTCRNCGRRFPDGGACPGCGNLDFAWRCCPRCNYKFKGFIPQCAQCGAVFKQEAPGTTVEQVRETIAAQAGTTQGTPPPPSPPPAMTKQKGRSISITQCRYLGGIPSLYNGEGMTKFKGTLRFRDGGIDFKQMMKVVWTVDATDINDFTIEGSESVGRRVSAGRVLAVGGLALLAPKKRSDKTGYIVLELIDSER